MDDIGTILTLLGGILGGLVVAVVILARLEDGLDRDRTSTDGDTPVQRWPQDPQPRPR